MIKIRLADINDAEIVTEMIVSLLTELTSSPYDKSKYISVTKELLNESKYFVYLASDENGKCVGSISVTESRSIYAGGKFGIIQELYVLSEYRSQKVGCDLIKKVIEMSREKKWARLEVGAPDANKWNRTVDFYKREGFIEIGPRLSFKLL